MVLVLACIPCRPRRALGGCAPKILSSTIQFAVKQPGIKSPTATAYSWLNSYDWCQGDFSLTETDSICEPACAAFFRCKPRLDGHCHERGGQAEFIPGWDIRDLPHR